MVKVFVLLASLLANMAFAAPPCALPHEREALDSRVLQSKLMVAALSCHQRREYNKFVRKFRRTLGLHGENLQAYFSRAYGEAADDYMNRFITELANNASSQSLKGQAKEFCSGTEALFFKLSSASSSQLQNFILSQNFYKEHRVKSCGSFFFQ